MAYQMIIQDIVATKLRARCQYDIKYPAPTDIMTILICAKVNLSGKHRQRFPI
jgi:hypothetical protein